MNIMWNHEHYKVPITLSPKASKASKAFTTLNPEEGSRVQLFRSLFRTDRATSSLHHDLCGSLCINSAFCTITKTKRGQIGLFHRVPLHQRINLYLATPLDVFYA
ncbi:hypothetical protein N7G274_009196 [Stereocaulon virgatum]|uniref:Uncharacterized protein n=1 Tax=Stereocaulon virgatum TaxID=373712 RepID=A0ABR3ZWG6_9LECA